MVTENNSQTNTFHKGMDTDTSYQMIDEGKYVFAKNIRISSLHKTGDGDTTNKYGEVRPIEGVVNVLYDQNPPENPNTPEIPTAISEFDVEWKDPENYKLLVDSIIATTSIRDHMIIIVKGSYYDSTQQVDPTYTPCFSVLRSIDTTHLDDEDAHITLTPVFTSKDYEEKVEQFPQKLSVEARWEDDDNIKLYIATGIDPIYVLNVSENNDEYNKGLNGNVDKIKSYPEVQFTPPIFRGIIQGLLKPAQVQYSYQLYNKNGIYSDVSPLTRQITIPENIGHGGIYNYATNGVQKSKKSNCGVALKFNIPVDYLGYIRIFRITYEESGQLPTVEIISDIKYNAVQEDDDYFVYFNDVGQNALSQITVEEYNSIAGIHIIPKVIESKNDRLFAANIKTDQFTTDQDILDWDARSFRFRRETIDGQVKMISDLYVYSDDSEPDITITYNGDPSCFDGIDETHDCYNVYNDINEQMTSIYNYCNLDVNGYVGGTGKNVSWRFITTSLYPDRGMQSVQADNTNIWYPIDKYSRIIPDSTFELDKDLGVQYIKYSQQDGYTIESAGAKRIDWYEPISGNAKGLSYANPNVSFALKSLKRDELYRYGIILYDKFGNNSGVKWIADIRTPEYNGNNIIPFYAQGNDEGSFGPRGNGQGFLISRPLGIEFVVDNLPKSVVAYEIVRCNRTISDVKNIAQGALSRPIKRLNDSITYPYTPTGLITTANYWTGQRYRYWQKDGNGNYRRNTDSEYDPNNGHEADNFENTTVFQFISPEVCYQEEYMKSIIQKNDFQLHPLIYIFPNINDESSRKSGSRVFTSPDPRIRFNIGESDWEYLKEGDNDRYTTDFKQIKPANFGLTLFHRCNYPRYSGESGNYVLWTQEGHSDISDIIKPTAIYNATGMCQADFLNPNDVPVIPGAGQYDYHIHGTPLNINDLSYPAYKTNGDINPSTHIINPEYINSYVELKKVQYSYTKMYPDLQFNKLSVLDTPDDREDLWHESGYVYDINDIKIPTTFNWDGGYGVEKSNTEANKKYKSGVIAIGTSQYCNWVIGGMYDHPVWDSNPDETVLSNNEWSNYPGKITTGPGGKCMILELKNANSDILRQRQAQIYIQDNEYTYLNITSMVGTWLCNLQQKIIPYGGYDYTSRILNTYYSYGDFVKVNNTNQSINTIVFNGDTFLSPFEYISMHKMYNGIPATTGLSQTIVYALPCETSINLAYTYGEELSKEYTDPKIVNVQPEPANVYNVYVQQHPLYSYNGAYSATPNIKTLASELNRDDVEDFSFDYRCYFSELKSNDERLESWTKFMPANFLDADSAKGEITNMQTFHDKLMFWQTQGTGLFSVNERSTITDDSNLPLILGTGGVLERYDYIDDTAGMAPEQYCATLSDSTLYWWDDYNQEIKSYKTGSTVLQLSKAASAQSILHKQSDTSKIPSMFFDNKYNEVVSNVIKDGQIAYNEHIQAFTSLYDIKYQEAIKMPTRIYLTGISTDKGVNSINVSQWNKTGEGDIPKNVDGAILDTRLDFVVNKSPLQTKVFDNQEIVTANKPIFNDQYLEGYPSPITQNTVRRPQSDIPYFKAHDGYNVTYSWITDLNQAQAQDVEMTYREGNYRYPIARADDAEYGNRMRGKYMLCSIKDPSPHCDASISFIITKFRASWS